MKCCQTKSMILDFMDGELPEPQAAAMQEHLKACASCRRELDETRQFLSRVQDMEPKSMPEEFWHDFDRGLERKILERRRGRDYSGWRVFAPALRPVVVSVVAAVVVAAWGFYIGLEKRVQPGGNPQMLVRTAKRGPVMNEDAFVDALSRQDLVTLLGEDGYVEELKVLMQVDPAFVDNA